MVTLVNAFAAEPSNQAKLVKVLEEATERVMRRLHGFVSANIHSSLDGRVVVNYAQWRTEEDFEAMLRNSEVRKHRVVAESLAMADPHLYRVESVHHI